MTDDPKRPALPAATVPARLAELAELSGGESSRSRRFLGGLVIGALAGAAIAGAAAARRRGQDAAER